MVQRRKRQLGQHFIKNPVTAEKIVSHLKCYKRVLEIGPGEGILTTFLLELFNEALIVEKDSDLIPFLTEKLATNAKIYNYDIMDKGEQLIKENSPLSIASNLPYNISAPLTFMFCKLSMCIEEMVLMYQKEVADRITKEISPLSVAVFAFYEAKEVMKLKPASFSPPPKVDSSVVYFERRKYPLIQWDEDFFPFLHQMFGNKRKILINNLKKKNDSKKLKKVFENINISSKLRVEQLSKEQIIKLYMEFKKYGLQIH